MPADGRLVVIESSTWTELVELTVGTLDTSPLTERIGLVRHIADRMTQEHRAAHSAALRSKVHCFQSARFDCRHSRQQPAEQHPDQYELFYCLKE